MNLANLKQGTSNGTLDFNLISLFPPTYKGRKNGLRIDIAEALEELNPVSFSIVALPKLVC